MRIASTAAPGHTAWHAWRRSGGLRGEAAGRRRGPGMAFLVALAGFASGAVVLVSLPLTAGSPSSHPRARHGLAALPLAARGVVARALGADDRRWFAHPSADGFVLGNRSAGVQASFSRRD